MTVGDRVDSDHHPLEMVVWGSKEENRGGKWKKRNRGVWNEEGVKMFKERIGEVEEKEEELNKEWDEMETRIVEAIIGVENEVKGSRNKKVGWSDNDYREAKKETRRKLKEWRKVREEGSVYRERRKEFKELCKRKKEEENLRWERKAMEARRESEVWEIVNRERRKRRGIEEGIEEEEWKKYFMQLLGGVEGRVKMGEDEGREGKEREEEEEISIEEMRRAIRKLKDGKAMGRDGIPGEAWKYGGKELETWAWRYINRVWKGGGWPENRKEGLIAPIVKKGKGKKVEEYRGVTIM
ncbi:vicilin-like seed storage protein At2g18540 [Temnothorax curvispinosus]|uniref:Vicilin-like seed storage protein At2g18540 n=1 Tax=Temnothorax curvispinosus TaxID=300111 RepID=A0A6J1Q6M2_9HYME|nr:vicilin-like seed storage protein At2g18540 [Temnothorax curvispinosus]